MEGASGEPVLYIASSVPSERLAACGDTAFCSRTERYFAEVPKWVMLYSEIRRCIARSSGTEVVGSLLER